MENQDRRYTSQYLSVEDTNTYLEPSWNMSGSRSVQQHQMPSPSSSVRTAMSMPIPMPMSRSYSSMTDYHANQRSPVGSNIDPILDDLSQFMPQNQGLSHSSYNHVARHLQDQPWNPDNMRTSSATNLRVPTHLKVPSALTSPSSDADSILPPDSGYHSHRPRSVTSNDAGRIVSRNVASDITLQVQHLNVESLAGDGTPMARRPSDMVSQISGRSGRSSRSIMCDVCSEVSKCKSDFKKHMLKHEKPFKCHEPNCKRGDRGFTTINDLDRHKKSVHRIGMEKKSYRCAASKCIKKDKIWPRLDNFKQHVSRMHRDEDEIDLIRRSQVPPSDRTSSIFDSVSAMPVDTGFAVAGMDKSFSNTPALEISPVDPLMDHDSSSWEAPGLMTEDSLNNTNRLSSQLSNSFLGSGDPRHTGPQHYVAMPRRNLESKVQQKMTRSSLDMHETMSTSVHGDSNHDRPQPRLSDAPQTKAEQQSASRKSSRSKESIQAPPVEPVDFQEFLLHALQDVTKSSQQNVIISREQALKISQEIAERIQQKSMGSTFTVQQRSREGLSSGLKTCTQCNHKVARNCDMRKHMKRHEKPYGCTYPKCQKRFGAKSDWKRHENNQHFQLLAFRCRQRDASGAICGHHSYRPSLFKQHLETQHGMSAEDATEECEVRKIGKNCQGSFWCGFCNDIIQLQYKRNEAWVERFTHIANHFEKRKKSIDDWICVESNRAKKDQVDDDEEETTVDEGRGEPRESTPPPPATVPRPSTTPRGGGLPPPPPPPSSSHIQVGPSSNKRPASDPSESLRRSRRRRILIQSRYCCACQNLLMAMEPGCITCSHQMCDSCPTGDEYMWDYDASLE